MVSIFFNIALHALLFETIKRKSPKEIVFICEYINELSYLKVREEEIEIHF
jgi:hypothetical protein